MRRLIASCIILSVLTSWTMAGAKSERYKIPRERISYPQVSPEKTLESVIKALDNKNFNYLLAQLADPEYVDDKVAQLMNDFTGPDEARKIVAFEKLVKQVKFHMQNDPSLERELRALAKKGVWDKGNNTASVRLPEVTDRRAYFRFFQGRWFLENRRHAKKKGP